MLGTLKNTFYFYGKDHRHLNSEVELILGNSEIIPHHLNLFSQITIVCSTKRVAHIWVYVKNGAPKLITGI